MNKYFCFDLSIRKLQYMRFLFIGFLGQRLSGVQRVPAHFRFNNIYMNNVLCLRWSHVAQK